VKNAAEDASRNGSLSRNSWKASLKSFRNGWRRRREKAGKSVVISPAYVKVRFKADFQERGPKQGSTSTAASAAATHEAC
jgi:hypothetical protein